MGTSAVSPGSSALTAANTAASITANTFTGVSSYASDLQQVISRSVAIASLPLNQMQNQLQTLDAKQAAMTGLDGDFANLQNAITSIDSAVGPSSYSATTSSGAVSASATTGALPASYQIDVTSLGSYSTSISDSALPAVSNPSTTSISTATDYTLNVNGNSFDIKPTGPGLSDLATAINSAAAGVQASIINTGNSGSPNYQLVVRSTNLAPDSIQLTDNANPPNNLLDTLSTGANATYDIAGVSSTISTNSRSVTLAPGVTVNLLQQTTSGAPVTVTIGRDTSAASSAVSSFVTAYNTAVDDLNQQVGQNAGPLSGDSVLSTLRDTLRQISQYTGTTGGVTLLSQAGITLDSTGHLTFDASQFATQSPADIEAFLGSVANGGFLKTASDALTGVEDPTTGTLKAAITDLNNQVTQQNTNITKETDKINTLQSTLQQQMASADAAIASLESQRNYITNLFTAMINNNNTGGSTGVSSPSY
jgi:flagellar hook-associated protein 2